MSWIPERGRSSSIRGFGAQQVELLLRSMPGHYTHLGASYGDHCAMATYRRCAANRGRTSGRP
jgi:hypothetical protein